MPTIAEYQLRRAAAIDAINAKFEEQDKRLEDLETQLLDTQEGVADIYDIILSGEGE